MHDDGTDWLSMEEATRRQAGERASGPLSWARIVWVDRACPDWEQVLNHWLARPCTDGAVVWEHNRIYVGRGPHGALCRFRVGDIRSGAEAPGPPEEAPWAP